MNEKLIRWTPALVPYNEVTGEVYLRGAVYMVDDIDEDTKKRFYEALLTLPWLASRMRYAAAKETGRSVEKRQNEYKHGRAVALTLLINERQKYLQKKGKRPRGGYREKAIEEIAEAQGVQPETIKKYLQRHKS
jgi:hypothetical protein